MRQCVCKLKLFMPSESGFLILRLPALLISGYEGSNFARANASVIGELRKALASLDPRSYRGISRDPIWPAEPLDAKTEKRFGDVRARRRFRELVDPVHYESDDDDVLPSLAAGREVWRLLDHPEEYEIVYVERNRFSDRYRTLGYDIGNWGGDHFSLIADTAVMPHLHPPAEDDFAELAARLRGANEHGLFGTTEAAESFRSFYRSRRWGETEFGEEFEIIRVASAGAG